MVTDLQLVKILGMKHINSIYFSSPFLSDSIPEGSYCSLRVEYNQHQDIIEYEYNSPYFSSLCQQVFQLYQQAENKNKIFLVGDLTKKIMQDISLLSIKRVNFPIPDCTTENLLYKDSTQAIFQKDQSFILDVLDQILFTFLGVEHINIDQITSVRNKFVVHYQAPFNSFIPAVLIRTGEFDYSLNVNIRPFKTPDKKDLPFYTAKLDVIDQIDHLAINWDFLRTKLNGHFVISFREGTPFFEKVTYGNDQAIALDNTAIMPLDKTETIVSQIQFYLKHSGIAPADFQFYRLPVLAEEYAIFAHSDDETEQWTRFGRLSIQENKANLLWKEKVVLHQEEYEFRATLEEFLLETTFLWEGEDLYIQQTFPDSRYWRQYGTDLLKRHHYRKLYNVKQELLSGVASDFKEEINDNEQVIKTYRKRRG